MNNCLKETQIILLDMLKWFHNFCEENNLRYYIIGGTMLGAIRHQGFIPWDDDIDVAMPRDDYDRFIKLCNGIRNEKYIVEAPAEGNKEYQYLYTKIFNTDTTLIENVRTPIKRGLFIDVFPLDGIGNSIKNAKINYRSIHNLIKLEMMIICAYRKERIWYKNLSIILGRVISPFFVSERRINKLITNMCRMRGFDSEEYVGNLVGNWGEREIMPRENFGTPIKYKFEGIEVYGVEKPDLYLKALYGDYMKLPSKDKRVSHHDYLYLDLYKSYLD